MPDTERRRSRRFPLNQPVVIRYETEGVQEGIDGVTENVSLTGVLLVTDVPIAETSRVLVTIVLSNPDVSAATTRLQASGQVTRVKELHGKFAAAIHYDQPLSQA